MLYRHLANDPRCPTELLSATARGLGWIGDDKTALQACRELSRRDSTRHDAYFGEAYYLRRLGYSAETVLPIVLQAYESAPNVALYRVALASLLNGVGEIEEAQDLIRGVTPESIGCRCCLQRVLAVFQSADDNDLGVRD